jgi:hypothetical protein
VPDDPAEIAQNRALTREPDTDDTGVGKDFLKSSSFAALLPCLQCGQIFLRRNLYEKQASQSV